MRRRPLLPAVERSARFDPRGRSRSRRCCQVGERAARSGSAVLRSRPGPTADSRARREPSPTHPSSDELRSARSLCVAQQWSSRCLGVPQSGTVLVASSSPCIRAHASSLLTTALPPPARSRRVHFPAIVARCLASAHPKGWRRGDGPCSDPAARLHPWRGLDPRFGCEVPAPARAAEVATPRAGEAASHMTARNGAHRGQGDPTAGVGDLRAFRHVDCPRLVALGGLNPARCAVHAL